ncbi:hypothetical protein KCP78_19420 [Salmonella enterica subsp. enterica]|nr:hypothetical protein KCP78_19420 [Salmonella enterica subsp. enterica]
MTTNRNRDHAGRIPASLAEARALARKSAVTGCPWHQSRAEKSRKKSLNTKHIQRQPKIRQTLAWHLLIICMVRKSELIEATWSEVNFTRWNGVYPAKE